MKAKLQSLWFILFFLISWSSFAQDVSLYQQFNGRYDFVFFGNTMNIFENGTGAPCQILTSSSAALTLQNSDVVEKAFLYWAGDGAGDFNVKLNNQNIAAERTFNIVQASTGRIFFSAFTDVTAQVAATGNGTYTLSELDVSALIADYCTNATNFAGWAIVVIFKNNNINLNQVNVYDGLQGVPNQLNITLSNLDVIDQNNSKIGFVAWEGDRSIAVNETLTMNGMPLGNPPLNPVNNAFNGTNSFTGSQDLYNMDLDVYDISGNIEVGDQSAEIQLTSGQDFVMINAVVTKLNSQLPDATVAINDVEVQCGSRKILVDYTVSNLNSTRELPANVRVAVYVDGVFIQVTQTTTVLDVNQSETGQISVIIPESAGDSFELQLVADDDGNGQGAVAELDENNNEATTTVSFFPLPEFNSLPELNSCNEGLGRGHYDFSSYEALVKVDPTDTVTFYETETAALTNTEPILDTNNYFAPISPKEIFVRIKNGNCFVIKSFFLVSKNCPPTVYNYVSANNDGFNDDFFIKGLRDVFVNFKLSIYNRWGRLVWTGNNNSPNWDGISNKGYVPNSGISADGTYYYVLELNDPDYPKPMVGFVYLTKV